MGTWAILVLYCECYACSCAVASLAYVHDALGYLHYIMQFLHTFRLTCFMGTITLWILDACMLLMGMLNQLQTEQTALSLSDKQYQGNSLSCLLQWFWELKLEFALEDWQYGY